MNYILKKIIKYTIIIVALILLFNITSNIIFSATNKRKNDYIETVETGTLEKDIPVAARNFEKNLEYSRENEMIEHYEVKGKGPNDNIYGYVQIWKTKDTLEDYLKLSKEYMSLNVHGFTETDVAINGIKWRKWEYIVNGISAVQGFCNVDSQIYMCALFVPYIERTYAFDKIFIELLQNCINRSDL